MPNGTIPGKLNPKIHTSQRKILGSKLVREVIPTRLVRRMVPSDIKSMCRPPPKPPDKQNGLEGEINKKMSPYVNPIYRPPNMKNGEEKEKKIWDYRTPPKPPFIQIANGERIGVPEKNGLPYAEPNYRPPPKTPPKPPPKPFNVARVPRTR